MVQEIFTNEKITAIKAGDNYCDFTLCEMKKLKDNITLTNCPNKLSYSIMMYRNLNQQLLNYLENMVKYKK